MFPEDTSEYPDHNEMYKYVKSYAEKHSLLDNIIFNTLVLSLEGIITKLILINFKPITLSIIVIFKEYTEKGAEIQFNTIKDYDKLWKLVVKNLIDNVETTYVTPYVCIASGHHSIPKIPSFKGQETFNGEIIHSIKYKCATFNNMIGKRVLVVGIGNSAVDVAVNLAVEGR